MTGQTATRIAVLALIEDDRVLLLQRSSDSAWMPNVWHVPGGHVESDETVQEAAVREIAEELGVTVAVEDMVFQGVVVYDETNGNAVDTFQFCAYRWSGEPRLLEPHRHRAMEWFQVDKLPDNITQHSRVLLASDRPVYVYAVDGQVVDAV